MTLSIRLPVIVLSILLVAGIAPAPAAMAAAPVTRAAAPQADTAGSLVFIRKNNVWISAANGSRARAVTRDGTARNPYRSPSADDAGHVIALRGKGTNTRIIRMDQAGKVLARFAPPILSLDSSFAVVSPNGKAIAYETLFGGTDCGFSPCHTFFEHSVEYSKADRRAALPGSHGVSGATHASWIGSGRTILSTPELNTVLLHRPKDAKVRQWFATCRDYEDGCEGTDVSNYFPAMSRQGKRVAIQRLEQTGDARVAYLLVGTTSGGTTAASPALPQAACAVKVPAPTASFPSGNDLPVSAPSFSPSGRSVAFSQRSGSSWSTRIYTPAIGNCAASDPVVVLKNASQVFWSAAPLRSGPITKAK